MQYVSVYISGIHNSSLQYNTYEYTHIHIYTHTHIQMYISLIYIYIPGTVYTLSPL